jgi:WD40 repeat protein
VTGGYDGIIRWWDSQGPQLIGTLPSHGLAVYDLAFSPDGNQLAAASGWTGVGELCLYQLARDWSRPPTRARDASRKMAWQRDGAGLDEWMIYLAQSPDASRVLTGGMGSNARLWDATTGQPLGAPLPQPWQVVPLMAFSPDGRLFVVVSQDLNSGPTKSSVQLWKSASRGEAAGQDSAHPLGPAMPYGAWIKALAFRADGKVLATGDTLGLVQFWDTSTGKRIGLGLRQPNEIRSLAFSPDGQTLAVGYGKRDHTGEDGGLLLDVASQKRVGQPMPGISRWVGFQPDGKRLVTFGEHRLCLWDPSIQEKVGDPIAESARVVSVAFRADGRMLVSAAADGTLRLRDLRPADGAPGKPIGLPMQSPAEPSLAVFSPDPEGKFILAGYLNGTARLWDRATQKPIGPPVSQGNAILAVAFAPDGRSFLTTTPDGRTRRWPVPPPTELGPDRLRLFLQVATGLEMKDGQTVGPLAPGLWEQCRRQLADSRRQAELGPAPLSEAHYHDVRARDAEQEWDSFGALWHLDRLIALQKQEGPEGESPRWLAYSRRSWQHADAGRGDQGDFAEVIAHSSREQLLSWLRCCIVDYQAGGSWDMARWYLDCAIDITPNDWRLHADRARCWQKLDKEDEREADRNRAVELGEDFDYLFELADDYASRGEWDRAEKVLASARQRQSCPAFLRQQIAVVILKKGDLKEFRKELELLRQQARQ